MTIHDLAEYEILDEHRVEDVQSDGFILRHKKSGARIAILSNNDDNKVFYIGFRTPNPYSSTVWLVSTIFALFRDMTGAPEEDSSTGMMRAAFSFTVAKVRSSFGEGMERIMERPPSTLKVSSSIFVLVAIVGLLIV